MAYSDKDRVMDVPSWVWFLLFAIAIAIALVALFMCIFWRKKGDVGPQGPAGNGGITPPVRIGLQATNVLNVLPVDATVSPPNFSVNYNILTQTTDVIGAVQSQINLSCSSLV